jgi:hypothetical protein
MEKKKTGNIICRVYRRTAHGKESLPCLQENSIRQTSILCRALWNLAHGKGSRQFCPGARELNLNGAVKSGHGATCPKHFAV